VTSDRLLLDTMLGTLATYLRMCGYDTRYALEEGVEADDALLELAAAENRRLLTRDRALAARAPEGRGLLLEGREIDTQLQEVADAGIDVEIAGRPVRCGACNGPLERVGAETSTPDYAPDPGETAVWQCTDCGQHFWRGSHWDDVAETLAGLE
jgi:uncharacterized protein with PIN domain